MKKKLKKRLLLSKETLAKLNEEQMQLIAGGHATNTDATIIIDVPSDAFLTDKVCNKPTVMVSKTCPQITSIGCPGC